MDGTDAVRYPWKDGWRDWAFFGFFGLLYEPQLQGTLIKTYVTRVSPLIQALLKIVLGELYGEVPLNRDREQEPGREAATTLPLIRCHAFDPSPMQIHTCRRFRNRDRVPYICLSKRWNQFTTVRLTGVRLSRLMFPHHPSTLSLTPGIDVGITALFRPNT